MGVEDLSQILCFMTPDLTIHFLQGKIMELQSALFFMESESVLRLPTQVISAEGINDKAQIWFMISRPSQNLHEFDNEFPVKLDFFKKGKEFFVKLQGTASFVHNTEECTWFVSKELIRQMKDRNLVLVSVKIQHADYYEAAPNLSTNWLHKGGLQFLNWLLNPQYDQQYSPLVAIPITVRN